jgi:hypothetical protein
MVHVYNLLFFFFLIVISEIYRVFLGFYFHTFIIWHLQLLVIQIQLEVILNYIMIID